MIRNYRNENAGELPDLKTASSSLQSKYSAFSSNASKLSNIQDELNKLSSNTTAFKRKDMLDNVISGFAAKLGNIKFKMPPLGEGNDGDDDGSLFEMLIKIILGIIQLPVRFGYFFAGLMESTAALAMSLEGLGQSVALGTKDIFTLVMAILNLIFKYYLCILSFTLTTISGCFFIHLITFVFKVVLLIFPLTVYVIKRTTGYNIGPFVDKAFEMAEQADNANASIIGFNLMRWPKPIHMVCYTCFGKETRLREVIDDFAAIQDIGDMIKKDFTKVMPEYLKSGKPLGEDALKNLDKAFN